MTRLPFVLMGDSRDSRNTGIFSFRATVGRFEDGDNLTNATGLCSHAFQSRGVVLRSKEYCIPKPFIQSIGWV